MRGLLGVLSLFLLFVLNNTRARMFYDIKITLNSHFLSKSGIFCHYVRNVVMGVITFPENL